MDAEGERKGTYTPGYELRARHTIFAEGCRGHLGKQLIARFGLDEGRGTQHYAIGLKELWDVAPERHKPGRVIHTLGWPLGNATGGSFLYHMENNQVALGLIVDLAYRNPHLSPFDEFQRWKHHPLIGAALTDGRRVAYGARAIVKGGIQALPRFTFPGGVLVGDDAGFLNVLKVKGTHTAMKSGMLAAEAIAGELLTEDGGGAREASGYAELFKASWLYDELHRSRNAGPGWHRFGMVLGSAHALVDSWFKGLPYTLEGPGAGPRRAETRRGSAEEDRLSQAGRRALVRQAVIGVSLEHQSRGGSALPPATGRPGRSHPPQPPGIRRTRPAILPGGRLRGARGERREARFQINAQNCVHCKTCDIKDPAQNINWVVPEGAGGPNYPNM